MSYRYSLEFTMRNILILLIRTMEFLASPTTYISGYWPKYVRRGFNPLPISRKILRYIGVLPIRHHYYETMVLKCDLYRSPKEDRKLPGIDMNVSVQLDFLKQCNAIGYIDYLWHHHREELVKSCPVLGQEPHRQPGSFWLIRN